ncbi:hypothetical protein [Janthinobacterium sp. RB2R34]|uniref:hypothetical protein n=1 Tax=Janthinobacterium sp. RB2R34 TaxID=3424193 RepID=UPI003F1ED0B4
MSALLGERDRLIMNTVPRYFVSVVEKAMLLQASTPVFAVSRAGAATPAAITITAELVSITGQVTFTVSPGATLSVSGKVATLQFADMGVDVAFVQAKVLDAESGVEFLRSVVVSKVFDGANGAPGTNGETYYTWVKYGDSVSGAGLSDSPAGKTFIGLAYNKATPVEGENPSDYSWSLIKGTDGVPGAPGADGQTLYTWIKYADVSDGTGMYDVPTANTMYLGLSSNRNTPVESTVKTDYVWSKFKGDQGVPGTAAPTLYTWVKYGDSASGAGLSDSPAGKAYIGLAYNKPTAAESTTPSDYEWSLIKGTDGQPGGKGADGATLYTWIKYADVADGTGLYDIPTANTLYLGLAVNKATSTESTNKSDYVWSKFKGDQGVPGTTGPQGQRGTKTVAAAGYSTWSDASAVAELAAAGFGAPINRDVVTLFGPSAAAPTFTMTKYYDNGSWVVVSTIIDGGLLVRGSVAAAALSVDRLSAVSSNLGQVTAGDIHGASMRGGEFTSYAWPGSGGGFYLGPEGLLFGRQPTGRYFQVVANGDIYSPGFTVIEGVARFYGQLIGATGSFSGNVVTGLAPGFRVEMGPDDPVYAMWAGSGEKNDTNAIFFLKRDRSAYFGGALTGGVLRTSVTNPTVDPAAQVVDGPFGSNGGTITVVGSIDWQSRRSSLNHYFTAGAGATQAVMQLYRKIGTSAETLVHTATVPGSLRISNQDASDEASTADWATSGSFTFTDPVTSTVERTYRLVVAITSQAVSTAIKPGAGGTGFQPAAATQRLTVITSE